ncbi:MAG TPA: hypothetical protein VFV93_04995 [Thermomicrobiales bacterium]|nr:hypothetical protein [Thermomicrobiales bacterium]
MLKALSVLFVTLLLGTSLVACGGDDDDDPTATSAPANTTSATATPAAATATAGSSPTATQPAGDAATASPSGSPAAGEFTDDEAALIDMLLPADALPGDWNQQSLEAPELDQSPGVCDSPPFPRAVERIAEVEVQYQSADGASFVLEDITRFPEDVAVEAMAYVRDTATCTEWTDDTGTVFRLSPADAPDLGDEAFSLHVAFDVADAGTLEGNFVFVRLEGYVAIVTTLKLGEYDQEFANQIAEAATKRIDALIGTGKNVTDAEEALMGGLLTLDDLDEDWDQVQPAHRSEPESWTGLCGADLFPQTAEATARVAIEFYEGFEPDSATLMQLLVAYPDGISEAAYDFEVEAASCGTFTGGDTDVTLETDSAFPALGDESVAVRFSFTNDGNEVEGYWIVARAGSALTTLIYTDPDQLDTATVQAIATTAVEHIQAIQQ